MAEFIDYVGIKRIKAKAATWAEAQVVLNRPVSEKDPAPDTPGYLVKYKDGYLSWPLKRPSMRRILRVVSTTPLWIDWMLCLMKFNK